MLKKRTIKSLYLCDNSVKKKRIFISFQMMEAGENKMATYQNLPNFNGLQVGDIIEYTYTGAVFPIVVKKGTYKITAYGAQGGYRSSATYGGQGGSAIGTWANATRCF